MAGAYLSRLQGPRHGVRRGAPVRARRRRPHHRLERHRAHRRAPRQALRRGARADRDAAGRRLGLAGLRLGPALASARRRSSSSALLALSAIDNGDKVGLLLFHGGADLYIPPRKGGKHALRVVREVLARGQEPARPASASAPRAARWFASCTRARAAGGSGGCRRPTDGDAAPARPTSPPRSSSAARCCRARAVLFLISDFLDDGYLQVAAPREPQARRGRRAGHRPARARDAAGGPGHARGRRDRRDPARRHPLHGVPRRPRERGPRAPDRPRRSAARVRHGSRRVRRVGLDGRPAARFFRERERRLRR